MKKGKLFLLTLAFAMIFAGCGKDKSDEEDMDRSGAGVKTAPGNHAQQ